MFTFECTFFTTSIIIIIIIYYNIMVNMNNYFTI